MQKSSLQKSAPILIRSAFDGLSDDVSRATGLECLDPTLTQQQFADEADINTIVNKFLRTGVMPDEVSLPRFGDFTTTVDNYHDALNLVIAADEAFSELPAKIRARFDNDAGKYVDFFNDPKNRAEAEELGLISKRQESSDNDDSNTSVADDSSRAAASQKSSSKPSKKAQGDPHDGGAGD
ncbi:MAG: internal scaffolding protein [Microvirus sp.]|nr:MAG: internal scaffolding protein [Microvirus sp.]